jgi:hypothetical protein
MAARGVVALVLLFALAGCGGSDSGTRSSGEIVELTGVDELRTAFAEDDGTARLLLVLSPT